MLHAMKLYIVSFRKLLLPTSENDFVIADMESQNQEAFQGSEEASMSLTQKEFLANINEMIKVVLQAKEGQQVVPNPLETSSKIIGDSVIQKLANFKKFTPEPFKEVKDSNEEWLEELDSVLETLEIEDGERMLYTESLLQGEAWIWWKMKKKKQEGIDQWKQLKEFKHYCSML